MHHSSLASIRSKDTRPVTTTFPINSVVESIKSTQEFPTKYKGGPVKANKESYAAYTSAASIQNSMDGKKISVDLNNIRHTKIPSRSALQKRALAFKLVAILQNANSGINYS